MTCRDVMTADPKCCLRDDAVAWAAEIMRDEDVGPVPVVSDPASRRLAGIITDRDIAIKVVAAGRDPRTTRVGEVMTQDVVCCCVDDEYDQALNAMARHQVRRIPIANEDGSLAGIISQADVARRSNEDEVGEVVEEISEPAGMGHALRSRMPHEHRREFPASANIMLMSAACMGIGAGLMYLMEPGRGAGRRARMRDKAASLYNDSADFAGKVQRDLKNRATGMAAEAKSKMKPEEEVPAEKLEARVRSKLGRVSSHPRAIHVHVSNGRVTLEGPVLADELNGIISAMRSLPGVMEVENRLELHDSAANIPALQGSTRRPREVAELMQTNWSPSTRFLAGALGGGLAIYGMRARGPLAKASAAVGAGLLARGISNKEITSWTDWNAARNALHL